jgi:hypothetical protein
LSVPSTLFILIDVVAVAKWLSFIAFLILLIPGFSNSYLTQLYTKDFGCLNDACNRHLIDYLNSEVKHGVNHKLVLNDIDNFPGFVL